MRVLHEEVIGQIKTIGEGSRWDPAAGVDAGREVG
jgi:hypothetical protein